MLELTKFRVTATLNNGNLVVFDTYSDDIEHRLEMIKYGYFKFYDVREFEPNRFAAGMKSDDYDASLEMFCANEKEFISRCEMLNQKITSFEYEEIEDDEE